MYTLMEIVSKGLLIKPDGQPFRDRGAVRKRLAKFNIKRRVKNDKGTAIYSVTEKQIAKMNKQYVNLY